MNTINEQKKKFEESVFYRTNNFTMSVKGKYNDFYIDECAISAVVYTDREIILTVRDIYREDIFEESLDKMLKQRWWCFKNCKKELEVELLKISGLFTPLYSIKFKNCFLKKYATDTYAYSSGTIHYYTVVLEYKGREYIKNSTTIMDEAQKVYDTLYKQNVQKMPLISEKDKRVLKYSNEMLKDCKNKVNKKIEEGIIDKELGESTIDAISKAIKENKDAMVNGLPSNL